MASRRPSTFSESWHRVAGMRLALRPSVTFKRARFRGERWHVLSDPFSNQYFRLRPAAHAFAARLDGTRTVEECWRECLEHEPEDAPGQEEVIRLLSELHQSNLLRGHIAPDSAKLFERFRKRRQREIRSKLSSLLFVRIPLVDPDAFLKRTLPAAGWLFTRFGLVLWLVLVGFGVKTAIDHWPELWSRGGGVLAPGNLPLLYLAMAGIKLLHELGHGYACRKFGGEVHTFGVMLLVFTPMPYVDATASWSFRERWKRIVVAAAGMYVELAVAAVAVFVWAATGPGLVNSLAYNLMFIASVSTILFNANPLLRFDGYYILTDLIEIPNLHRRSGRFWKHLAERHLFGIRTSTSPATSRRETAILAGFGISSWIYRIFLYAGIILFVAERLLIVGLVFTAYALFTWLVLPVGRLIRYLASSPRLERTRTRAVAVTAGGVAAVAAFLQLVPFPRSFSVPGIVQSEGYRQVFLEVGGRLEAPPVPSGTRVEAGDVLARCGNPELELQLAAARAHVREMEAAERMALENPGGRLEAIRQRLVAAREQVEELADRVGRLELQAPASGVWTTTRERIDAGLWLPRGALLGEIVDPEGYRFTAVVPQEDAGFLFNRTFRSPRVRLRGQSGTLIEAGEMRLIPAERRRLPSAALGWMGGGDFAVTAEDGQGETAEEAFFEVRAALPPDLPEGLALRHGISGKLKANLPASPILPRAVRALRQLLQRRFGI